MSTFPFFTAFVSKVVRTISLNRILVWAVTALIFIVAVTVYENNDTVLSYFTKRPALPTADDSFFVGIETQNQVQSLVTGDRRIVGVSVMSADLRLNEAKSLYFFGDSAELSSVKTRSEYSGNRLPMFTGNEENNKDVIKLINGEFTCVPFTKTLQAKIYPELSPVVNTLCMSSIPSYYGYFSGFVVAYISEAPSPERQLQYKLFIEKLANDIYFRDVVSSKQNKKGPVEN
jgi:hypothetical protein